MPGDEIESVSGFEAVETKDDDTQSQHKEKLSNSKETVADNVLDELVDMANSHNVEINASTENPSLSDPFEFHALNTLKNNKIDGLQKNLTKAIKTRASKSSQRRVKKAIKGVTGLLQYYITQLDKNVVNLRELVNLIRDLFISIDSGSTSTKVSLEGEKMSTQENKDSENKDSDTTDHAPAQEEQQPNEIQTKQATADEEMANAQGEQSSEQAPPTAEQVPLVITALVVQSSEEKVLEEKPIEDEPLVKRLRLLVLNLNIPSPTPLNSFMPQGIKPPVVINMPLDQLTDCIFNTGSSEFSPTPPPIVTHKGKGIAYEDDQINQFMPLLEQGGSSPKLLNLQQFSIFGKKMTLEETKAQMEEIKRLEFLKDEKEKSEKRLKVKSKSNDLLLKNLKAKFQWLKTQGGKLSIPPPPHLTAFELPPTEKKRNLTLPEGVVGKAGMVIKEPEAGIFLYNCNFDLVFQRRTSNEDSLSAKHQRAVKGLVECKASASNLRRIQVKDIVKEVEDILKTYSSAGMDITCCTSTAGS
ncbi:hypothetical protein Tco_0438465 [Tanacetum coccineum]